MFVVKSRLYRCIRSGFAALPIAVAAVVLAGCNYHVSKIAARPSPIGTPTKPPGVNQDSPGKGLKPTFQSLQQNIFQKRCAVCHKPGSVSGVVLTTWQETMDSGVIEVGKPEESDLYMAIRGKRMPPPKTKMQVSDDEMKVIYEWIKNGASEG